MDFKKYLNESFSLDTQKDYNLFAKEIWFSFYGTTYYKNGREVETDEFDAYDFSDDDLSKLCKTIAKICKKWGVSMDKDVKVECFDSKQATITINDKANKQKLEIILDMFEFGAKLQQKMVQDFIKTY